MDRKPDRVLLTFIAAPPEKAWALLTDPDRTPEWFMGHRMEVGQAIGDRFQVLAPGGKLHIRGEVLAIDPPRRLMVSWQDSITGLPPIEVEWLIESAGEATRLTVHEYHHAEVPEKWLKAGREGWSLILAVMKTMLETGKSFPPVKMEPPQ